VTILSKGPGFPLTRKRVSGYLDPLIGMVVIALLTVLMGLDSVEFERFIEYLKSLNAISLS